MSAILFAIMAAASFTVTGACAACVALEWEAYARLHRQMAFGAIANLAVGVLLLRCALV